MTKQEKTIKVLKAMSEHQMKMYDIHLKDGNNKLASDSIMQSLILDDAIAMLTNDQFLDRMIDIFLKDGDK